QEEERSHGDEGEGPGLLVRIEAGGDEGPDLVEDERRGHEDPHEEGHLHVQHQRLGGPGVDELDAGIGSAQGLGQEVEDPLSEAPADREARHEREQAADETDAQLFQVLQERHAVGMGPRHLGGRGYLGSMGGGPWLMARGSVSTTGAAAASGAGAGAVSRTSGETIVRSLSASTSSSIVRLKSFDALRNSAIMRPTLLPISGSLRGPKTMRAMTRIRKISGPPRVPNMPIGILP